MTLRRKATWIPVFAVLLAYLLRTSTLDFQSFWIDEIQAFYFIDRPLKETIKLLIAPDENGPLYFLLLWFWRRVGGPSDFGIRYLSDLFSVLTVAVMWQLARTWFSRRVAGLTAVFLAISPFAIWHGQEAKMYGLHMFLAGLSTLLLIKAANRTARRTLNGLHIRLRTPHINGNALAGSSDPENSASSRAPRREERDLTIPLSKTMGDDSRNRPQVRLRTPCRTKTAPAGSSDPAALRGAERDLTIPLSKTMGGDSQNGTRSTRTPRAWPLWLGYGIVLNLLGYSHFFGAFTIAAQGFALVVTHLKQLRVVRTYVLTMIIVVLPYIPVVSFALRVLPDFQMQDISKGFVPLRLMLHELASEYILRASRLYVEHMPRLLAYGAIVILLGSFRAWRLDWRKGLWVTSLLVLPIAIFYPISFRVPVFSPKYLSATFLIFTLCLGLAVDQLGRWWKPLAWVGLAGVVALNGWANVRILTDPTYQRGNWKAAAAYLEAHIEPGDAIIGFADYIHRGINRYYDGHAPVYRFKGNAYAPEEFYRDVLQNNNDHHTLWLVLHQDQAMAPQNRLQEVAGLLYPQITGVYPNNGRIAILGYSVRWQHNALPSYALPVGAAFENGLALVGYTVDATELKATDNLLHPPSNWIHVTTYWQRSGELTSDDITPYIHMVDAQGGVWGGELQRVPTVFHRDPASGWDRGTIVEAHYDVNLNPATPAGSYRLVVGLVDGAGEAIPMTSGKSEVKLTEIRIVE